MAITRWDPFRDVLALQNRMNSLFQDFNRTSGEGSDLMTTAAFVQIGQARLATLGNPPERDRRSALMYEASIHESMSLVNVRRNWIR